MQDYKRDNRWLKSTNVAKKADVYYFGGCLPFLDVVFESIGFEGEEIGVHSVRILNAIGVTPAVSDAEVCCGHDAYWTGRTDLAMSLAERNVKAIRASGAKHVIFSCPECYFMFKKVYPEIFGKLGFEVSHITSVVARAIEKLKLRPAKVKATFHDPCRLAKSFGIVQEPRQIINAIEGTEFLELKRVGAEALCCGSSNWISCSRVNKRIQLDRLDEAYASGAELLITSCPKCNIHLRCAVNDQECLHKIEIKDLMVFIGNLLARGRNGA